MPDRAISLCKLLVPLCMLAAYRPPVLAEPLIIEFDGLLQLDPNSTVLYFGLEDGTPVHGRFLFDPDRVPKDKDARPESINYNRGALPWAELSLLGTEFDAGCFDFTIKKEAGVDDDRLRLEPLDVRQNLYLQDGFSDNGQPCDGEGSPYCWRIQLSVLLPPDTLPVAWPPAFAWDQASWFGGQMRFVLQAEAGFMAGEIALLTLQTVGVESGPDASREPLPGPLTRCPSPWQRGNR